jgi:hypothetical protein
MYDDVFVADTTLSLFLFCLQVCMENQPRSQRLKRKAQPKIDDLKDGQNRYIRLLDALEAADEEDTVAILPPPGSDEEDMSEGCEEVAGLLQIVSPNDDDNIQTSPFQGPWRRNTKLKCLDVGPRIPSLSETHPLLATRSPMELFRLYYTQEIAQMMVDRTLQYARQNGDMSFTVSVADMDNFIIILLYTSYMRLPRQEMYWQRDFDLDIPFVPRIMRRQKFRDIKKYLHFCDNNNINVNENRFAKIQPLLDLLNASLVQFGILYDCLSVDEQMIGYTGRHPSKQYIRGKPVKWGYKMWLLCDATGYPYHIWPYQGRSGQRRDEPLGSTVVKKMISVVQDNSSLNCHKIFMDNFFTSIKLMQDLRECNLRATGIIRNNRIRNIPLKDDTELTHRGDYDNLCNGQLRIIKLHDSKIVTLVTNFDTVEPLHNTDRNSKTCLFK